MRVQWSRVDVDPLKVRLDDAGLGRQDQHDPEISRLGCGLFL